MKKEALQTIIDSAVDGKKVFGCNFAIKYKNEIWHGSAGNISLNDSYFIASTTKLFTTALILQLRNKNLIHLDTPIHNYLDPSFIRRLHVLNNIDYTNSITVKHLLSHTSGLPDYFQDKSSNGISLENQLKQQQDRAWSLEEIIEINQKIQPLFIPGKTGKAHYSDTNFQLLGQIIEKITGKSYKENCKENIFDPLQLSQTYLFEDVNDQKPVKMYYKNSVLDIPLAMTSFKSDGGLVSATLDLIRFIEAFFKGELFPLAYIEDLKVWNKIFFPMQSGKGIHRFKLPWFFDPTGAVPELIGHSGLSGTLAYYSPKHDLFIVGTVNQIAYPDKSFKTAIKLIRKAIQ